MAIKYQGQNSLTALLTLLSGKFETKVDKVDGKGLSTNDFSNEAKAKLEGIAEGANKYVHAQHTAHVSGLYKITVDAEGHVSAVTEVAKADITELGIPGQDTTYVVATAEADGLMSKDAFTKLQGIESGANKYIHATHAAQTNGLYKITVDGEGHVSGVVAVAKEDITALGIPGELTPLSVDLATDAADATKAASAKAVVDYVNSRITSTYKPQGSVAYASLPTAGADTLGNVYNITDAFTTDDRFVEGAGKAYAAGSNVVVVQSGESYKYDVLAGFIDLTPYLKAADAEATYLKKADAQATYATKTELGTAKTEILAEFEEITAAEVQNTWNTVFGA